MKINLSTLNNIQKLVIAIFFSLILVSLFLHNPLSGYITEHENYLYTIGLHKRACNKEEKDEYRADFEKLKELGVAITKNESDTQAYIESTIAECTKQIPRMMNSPFINWRTNKPLIGWFGSIYNLFQVLAVSLLISLIFLFIFKGSRKI